MPTSIRLDEETEQRFNFLAAQTGRPKAFYLREVVQKGLDDLEDYYLAADVVERIRKGEEKTLSTSEMRELLDLDN